MHFSETVFVIFPLILSVLGNPVPNISLKSQDSPGTLEMLTYSVEGLLDLGEGVAQEIFLLESALGDSRNGKIKPVSTLEEALASLAKVSKADKHSLIVIAADLVLRGLAPQSVLDILTGLADQQINSIHNRNADEPVEPVFPQKSSENAPYSQEEDKLRSAIYIPEDFQFGADGKRPVLLVPGTVNQAGSTYYFDYEKLLADTNFADPVWVNIPGNLLSDVQVNSEYVAYAINYISGISNNTKIGVISWSQGGLDVQWALKYWPSTREAIEDFMPISADFHGSLFEYGCLVPTHLCTPAIKQQGYNSNLIQALPGDDGNSAYVPTTSVYSGVDEVVQPQLDPNASGHLLDVRNVGVTNTQIQLACPGFPAGNFYLHETMLINPITYALVGDALTHEGPGQLSRIDLDTVCNQFVPPGLGLTDLLGTEAATAVYAVIDILTYGYIGDSEPPLKNYVYGRV